jgi:serine/threonine protein phosphatase 1
MFKSSSRNRPTPSGPRGQRAYVVGDVHGRLDLLEDLLARIHADLDERPSRKTMLVFVGDLIDRGPNSAQVIERLRTYRRPGVRTAFILGNHEEVLLRILAGEAELIDNWRRFGGKQCLESYGVDVGELIGRDDDAQLEVVREAIPKAHVEFLSSFVDSCRFGDYLFVHAGIRPGVELERQLQSDLRWIRQPFLLDGSDHGFVVVHGHTITSEVDEKANRIGIDTGAYHSGVLTALAIEDRDRWYLDTKAAADMEPLAHGLI